MEARENSNTKLSLALGPRKNTKRGPRKNTKRVLSLKLSLGAQQVQGSSDENAKKSRLSKEQAAVLEANFNDHPNPDTVMIFFIFISRFLYYCIHWIKLCVR